MPYDGGMAQKQIQVRFNADEVAEIHELVEIAGMSRARFFRTLVAEHGATCAANAHARRAERLEKARAEKQEEQTS